jgi:carbamoylphosphate synthase small subunit
VCDEENLVMGVQYHPESAAGPEDSDYLYEEFLKMLRKKRLHEEFYSAFKK